MADTDTGEEDSMYVSMYGMYADECDVCGTGGQAYIRGEGSGLTGREGLRAKKHKTTSVCKNVRKKSRKNKRKEKVAKNKRKEKAVWE